MEKKEVEKLFNDLAEATGEAIALVASAIARQTDAEIFCDQLRAKLNMHRSMDGNDLARRIAMQSLNALEEECEIQKPANH